MGYILARREFVGAASSSAFLLAGPAMAAGRKPQVAIATGPIPVTAASGEPFRGVSEQPVAGPGLPLPDLARNDYVEEEYFISGTVEGAPYKTSMLVRRPRDPRKFSGLVAVETIHASGAIPLWGNKRIWLAGGHAWVGVTSQLSSLNGSVRKSNPQRYASLVLPVAPAPPGASPMQQAMGSGAQDAISQAIMTQVGHLLRQRSRRGPFAGYNVRYLLMGGASQTGGTTLRYIQQSHAAARRADGGPLFDAYLPSMAFPGTPLPPTDAVIVHIVTEGDLMNSLMAKRPLGLRRDGDGADRYRHYQIAGDSHVGMRGVTDPLTVFSTLGNVVKPGEHLSQFPASETMFPLVGRMVDWLMKGIEPPRAAPIELANGEIVRDEHGNAKGGVRSPWVDLPTVRYIAAAPMAQGDNFFRRLIGLEEPFPPEKLRALYGTREAYLQRFGKQIDDMVAGGWLFADDAVKLKAEEAKSAVF